MTSIPSWSPTLPETVWSRVATALRSELGEGPYNSYVAPAILRQRPCGTPVLVTPTVYARDWFSRNALHRIHELWSRFDPEQRLLELKARTEFELMAQTDAGSLSEAFVPPLTLPQPLPSQPFMQPVSDVTPSQRPSYNSLANTHVPPKVFGLQERLTFDSFVRGPENEFACNMAHKVAIWTEGHFNPIFFHGPYGYGKTHLLNAIAWEAQAQRPEAKIVYLTAEKFTSGFVKAVMDRSTSAFKDELRGADLLLIDDVHFIGGKTSSQEELFHTLTSLIENNRQVVFSSVRPPSHLNEVEERLRSYLSSGLVCALEPADRALRMGIVERKLEQLAKRLGLSQMPNLDVLQFLSDRVPGSIRELEGAVNTLAASAGARLGSLTLEEAMALLQPNLKVAVERRITVDEIQKLAADHFGLKQADLLSERRTRAVARPRQVAMWLCKQHTTRSYPDIGRRFGGRDHTTVLHAVKKIEELLLSDEQIAKDVEALTQKLRNS